MLRSLGTPREHEGGAKGFVERASFVLAYQCSGSFQRWIMGGGTFCSAPLSLLKHQGATLLFESHFQLHRLLHLRRSHGALQRSECLGDGGSPDPSAERDKLLGCRRAAYKQCRFMARAREYFDDAAVPPAEIPAGGQPDI
jgi:hypothetical protein